MCHVTCKCIHFKTVSANILTTLPFQRTVRMDLTPPVVVPKRIEAAAAGGVQRKNNKSLPPPPSLPLSSLQLQLE
jgi:hypothetical protein